FYSSDFEARETFLTFLEVVRHALLESLFVQNSVIEIGACAI
ncbi:9677_t:CDS:2, partial [Gigaspora margarita]